MDENKMNESEYTPAEESLDQSGAASGAGTDTAARRRRSRILAGLTVGACVLGASAAGLPTPTVVSIR